MHTIVQRLVLAAIGVSLLSAALRADDFESDKLRNWHQWRGPLADGVAPLADPPVEWDEKTNVKWKVEIPGRASATPIVWKDQIFVLTAIQTDRTIDLPPEPELDPDDGQARLARAQGITRPDSYYRFVVMSLDRETGRVRWQHLAREEVPHEGLHRTNSYASASPTTDGRYLYASFGSRGIYCYDLDGNLRWERDLGDMKTMVSFGEGISPVMYGDSIVVNWDHEGDSFLYVLNTETGETKWKVARDEGSTWATPLVVNHQGRTQVIINAPNRTRSYDLATGEVIWQCGGQTSSAIPSPVANEDTVFCMSGYRGRALLAIPLDARGELTDTNRIAWNYKQGTPYVPSPLLYGDELYFVDTNRAILTCLDARTGKPIIDRRRLEGVKNFYGSPVAAAERIYFVSRDGSAIVLRRGAELEVLANNKLDEGIDASPAVVGKEIFLRGEHHLYCIAGD